MASSSSGACRVCDRVLPKGQLTRHLKSCLKRTEGPLHQWLLVIEARYRREYWLYLTVPPDVSLEKIDSFLRDIWVECCGHLSAFDFNNTTYLSEPEDEGDDLEESDDLEEGDDLEESDDSDEGDDLEASLTQKFEDIFQKLGFPADNMKEPWPTFKERDMAIPLQKVVHKGDKMKYQYDFGSTTELTLRVLDEDVRGPEEGITVVARNDRPQLDCEECGQPAELVATDWNYVLYCASCADKLGDEEKDFLLPVVNSPRMGVCDYCGGDEDSQAD